MPGKSLCSGSRAAFGAVCTDRHYLYPVSDFSFRRTSDHCIDRSGRFPCRRDCRFAGVAAGSFLSFRKSPYTRKNPIRIFSLLKDLFTLSFPISLNRILLTLLGSIEAVLIPQMLLRSGMTASDSLKIYGIFTGMALPLLLFPSTLTSSAAVMLMPSIAQLDALGEQKQIRRVTDQTFFCACSWDFYAEADSFFLAHSSEHCFFTARLPEPTYGICLLSVLFFIQTPCSPASCRDLENRGSV